MNTTKILISGLVLTNAKSGYYRVLRNLLLSLTDEFNGRKYEYYFIFQKNAISLLEIAFFDLHKSIKIIEVPNFKSKWIRGIYEQIAIPVYALVYGASFIFMPATFGLLLPVRKSVVFIHTNTSFSVSPHLRARSWIQQKTHHFLSYITALTSYKLLFTSKQTYAEYSKFVDKKLPSYIIGNGIMHDSSNIFSTKLYSLIGGRNYILAVSQIYRLKNFSAIIQAFKIYISENRGSDAVLVLVGTVQETDYYREIIDLIQDENNIFLFHNLNSDELTYLYRNSKFYVSMSLFEGFSLTPAESLMNGRPVLLSNIAVHLEIYSRYAVFANPLDIYEIAEKFCVMFASPMEVNISEIENDFSQFAFNKRLMSYFV